METRSVKRKKKNVQQQFPENQPPNADRLTDLPDDIIHRILSYLPIKSVAQTSVLSKRCKTIWHSFPDLDFTTDPRADQIWGLLHNRGSDVRALKFRSSLLTFSRLTALIRQAVKYNVRELDAEISTCDYFNIPRALIQSSSLESLRLKSCHPGFRLPPLEIMRDGFRSLTVLTLSRPIFHDDLFMDSCFPLLKKLHLENCLGMKRLRVECPALEDLCLESCFQLKDLVVRVGSLKRLRVSSCFDPHCFGSSVRVEAQSLELMVWSYNAMTDECAMVGLTSMDEAFVGFYRIDKDTDLSETKVASVRNFLIGISDCRSLTLESQCIEIISKSSSSSNRVSLCPAFNKLEYLELSSSFKAHNNPGLATLFRSSPNAHTIVIKIVKHPHHRAERRQWNRDPWQLPSSEEEKYWESQAHHLKSFLTNLKVVKIHGFTESANNVSLVKFLLKNGKELQHLFLCTANLSTPKDSLLREKIKAQIMGFSQASSNSAANIVFQ